MFKLFKKKPVATKSLGPQCTVVVAGFSGSGKTTLGKRLASRLSFTYLDKDILSRSFVEQMLVLNNSNPDDRESDFYGTVCNPIEYSQLAEVSKDNIMLGNSTVLSAPFIRQLKDEDWFTHNLSCAHPDGHKIKLVWIDSTRETERVRMIDRNASRDSWKLRNWETYCASIKGFERDLPSSVYRFSNEDNCEYSFHERIDRLVDWVTR